MSVLSAWAATLQKMFAADLVLTVSALLIVAATFAALRLQWLNPNYACAVLGVTIAGALFEAVRRGLRK